MSDETRISSAQEKRWPAGSNCLSPLWSDKEFGQAISVGSFCHAAIALRLVGFRRFSGPFDWIFSNPRVATHMLSDNFQSFLDPAQYEPIPEEARITEGANLCDHRFYRSSFGLRSMFNHHSPDLAADHAYFQRAVQRFRGAMRADLPPLLLLVTHSPIQSSHYAPMLDALDTYGRGYGVLVVRFVKNNDPDSPNAPGKVHVVHHDAKLLCIEFRVNGLSTGVKFEDDVDDHNFHQLIESFKVAPEVEMSAPQDQTDDSSYCEASYLGANPDVASAVVRREFESGWEHYQKHGRSEGRRLQV